ncbi:hypothetical protein GCM10023063_19450 [Arthrobacter methylotrophus]
MNGGIRNRDFVGIATGGSPAPSVTQWRNPFCNPPSQECQRCNATATTRIVAAASTANPM